MHRFLGRFVVGAGALLIATAGYAQGTSDTSGRPFKIGGALGASVPLGDFSDAADLGWHMGGLIEYKPQSLPISWRGEITYHRNSLKDGAFAGFPNVNGNASILGFVANALFPFGDAASTARPFVIGGLGVYHAKRSGDLAGGNTLSRSDTDFGLNVGGGFTFNLSGFATFVEMRYHSVFTEDSNTNFIPVSFGFKF